MGTRKVKCNARTHEPHLCEPPGGGERIQISQAEGFQDNYVGDSRLKGYGQVLPPQVGEEHNACPAKTTGWTDEKSDLVGEKLRAALPVP